MCQKPDMKQYAKHDGSAVTKDIRPQIKLCRKEKFENLLTSSTCHPKIISKQ